MADDVIHLKPGDPPPGSFEPGAHGLRVWQGPCEWRTTHGTATVHWLLGRPNRIQGAMTAEGPLDIETSSPLDRETWRRRSPEQPGRWILGTVEIRDDGVAFTDKPSTPFEPFAQGDVPDLAADLSADAAFVERVRDVGFAHAVYASLCNTEWRKDPSRRRWSCSWRTAGGLVADLRQLDESYIDFYLQDHVLEGGLPARPAKRRALSLEVLGHYRRLGWHLVEAAEARADHEAALAALAAHEGAAPGRARTGPNGTRNARSGPSRTGSSWPQGLGRCPGKPSTS